MIIGQFEKMKMKKKENQTHQEIENWTYQEIEKLNNSRNWKLDISDFSRNWKFGFQILKIGQFEKLKTGQLERFKKIDNQTIWAKKNSKSSEFQ